MLRAQELLSFGESRDGEGKLENERREISKPKLQNLKLDGLVFGDFRSNLRSCNFGLEISPSSILKFFCLPCGRFKFSNGNLKRLDKDFMHQSIQVRQGIGNGPGVAKDPALNIAAGCVEQ